MSIAIVIVVVASPILLLGHLLLADLLLDPAVLYALQCYLCGIFLRVVNVLAV